MHSSDVLSIRWLRVTVLLSWAGLSSGQISGPVTGYIFHSATNSIRPILGVPGSALVANPIVRDVQFGSVSPDGRWALVQHADSAAIVRLGGAVPEELPLTGMISGIDMAAWSGSGTMVAACSSSMRALQPVRLSGEQWAAEPAVGFSNLAGALTALASNYAGDRIAIGLTDPTQGGLYLVNGAAPVLLMPAPLPVIAGFAPRGEMLYAAGADAGVIRTFDGSSPAGSLNLASGSSMPPEVAGMAPSSDGKRLFVVLKDTPGLQVLDLASGQALPEQPLEITPSALLPIARGPWLLLSSPRKPSDPLFLVKDSDPSVTYFVPVVGTDPTSL